MLNGEPKTQCSQPVFLSISVLDEPDLDPQFVREFYSASVAEDAVLVCAGVGRGLGSGECLSKGSQALIKPPPREPRC